MKLTRWTPTRDFFGFQDEMNKLMERFFEPDVFPSGERFGNWLPSMDVVENKDAFTVELELPGLRKDDISISLENNVLTIEGERKREHEEKDANVHRMERSYGTFLRRITIPTQVEADKIDAVFKEGILKIHLPKTETVKPKAITVKVDD